MTQTVSNIFFSSPFLDSLYQPLVEPYADEAYYVGFKVGDQEIGLDPNGHIDAGAKLQQEVKDVGGGKMIASVKDKDSNIIGLIQLP